ncbi:hypothetical protein KDA_32650 [Dictyobacter alpinus]|uniref:Glycosyltransferase RgtA/B/C/D-like domain-containing protein n=1 Tax=Dictyobacter alpinus TaxID=2014873 RepID=A0A402B8T4_9CHLR|nr:hypothetical protein [Dictyobacter alpinus]GCE27781.1 hypothetical protein KDA_32650 [Dictyobacter alpinus]
MVLFCVAITLRVFLAYYNWPLPNSDEGTMGLMGMHIQQGARPILFYDQDYMGVLQAYLGAFFFTFLSPSVFTLRLGMVTLYAGFLLSMYFLVAQLYTKRFALFVVALFSFGSAAMLSRQLIAIGGYAETVFFATLSLAIGLRLALTIPGGDFWYQVRRYGLFFLWGLAITLGIWNDTLILPWVACSSLLLLFTLRELFFKGTILAFLIGLLCGGIPLIIYNLNAPIHHDTISVLVGQLGHVPLNIQTLLLQIKNTFIVSLPTISGSPTCYKSEYSFLSYWGFGTYWHSYCTVTNSIWSIGFVLLAVIATCLAAWALIKMLFPFHWRTRSPEERRIIILNCTRLILIAGILGTLLPYLRSATVINGPGANARYLLGVWIGLPALLWPLWSGATALTSSVNPNKAGLEKAGKAICISILSLLLCISLYGTYLTVVQIPTAQAATQTEQQLIEKLKYYKITHLYADYWVSYRLNFETQASIICASYRYNYRNNGLIEWNNNKYKPYMEIVNKDPYASYLISRRYTSLQQSVEKQFKAKKISVKIIDINGEYIAIQPIRPK